MKIAHKARVFLINIGKQLPFLICFLICFSYIESIFALLTNNIVHYAETYTLRKPISQFIGCYFEYDWVHVFVLSIIAFAVETCKWNKISVLYLALHLTFKHYIIQFELEPTTIYIICTINIAISGYLTWKGLKRLFS